MRGKLLAENIVRREGDPQNELRLGGNYLQVNDPNKPPYTPFYMMVTGHIQSGTFDGQDGICCHFDMACGTDWQVHSVSTSVSKKGKGSHDYDDTGTCIHFLSFFNCLTIVANL